MGQVERSSELTLSFWFSLDNEAFEGVFPTLQRDGQEGKSGRIMLAQVLNPKRPMILDKHGDFIHPTHKRCPVSKIEILNDLSLLNLKSVRSNPNCFTGGLEELAKHKARQKKAPEVAIHTV